MLQRYKVITPKTCNSKT